MLKPLKLSNTCFQFLKWSWLSEIECWISNKDHFNVFKARAISWLSLKRMKIKSWAVYGFDNQIILVTKTKSVPGNHMHLIRRDTFFWGGVFPLIQDIRKRREKMCIIKQFGFIICHILNNFSNEECRKIPIHMTKLFCILWNHNSIMNKILIYNSR